MSKPAILRTMPLPKAWLAIVIGSLVLATVSGLLGLNAKLLDSQFKVDHWINAHGGHTLSKVAVIASTVYSPKWAVVLILVLAVVIWLVTKSRLDGLGFLFIIGAGWLPAEVFKLAFNEPRPNASHLVHANLMPKEVDSAFPSGHLCFALAIGYALYLLTKRTKAKYSFLAFWILSAGLEAWARLYVGVHYLNDLTGSLFTTLSGVLILAWVWNNWLSEALSKVKFIGGAQG